MASKSRVGIIFKTPVSRTDVIFSSVETSTTVAKSHRERSLIDIHMSPRSTVGTSPLKTASS